MQSNREKERGFSFTSSGLESHHSQEEARSKPRAMQVMDVFYTVARTQYLRNHLLLPKVHISRKQRQDSGPDSVIWAADSIRVT